MHKHTFSNKSAFTNAIFHHFYRHYIDIKNIMKQRNNKIQLTDIPLLDDEDDPKKCLINFQKSIMDQNLSAFQLFFKMII